LIAAPFPRTFVDAMSGVFEAKDSTKG